MTRLINIALAIGLLAASASAQSPGRTDSTLRGVVFTVDSSGAHAIVPAARVSLDGPMHIETESDSEGKFAFNTVPSGFYTINGQAPGMTGQQSLTVTAGAISEIALEMKIQTVMESTTVTASADSLGTKQPYGTSTISESEVSNLPNLDERFNSLLPLIPGVVRGPNGLINMKGARASQNGSLVNSADVSDPATGTIAINIPIDVVSSVQVLSTPYDPEYGKFTGAVSNVETRPGNFNKFRMSFQNLLPRVRRVDGSIMGIAAATPRLTVSGPIVKDRVAFTQSLEYRYERTQVDKQNIAPIWTAIGRRKGKGTDE